jgi:hypothetical protein
MFDGKSLQSNAATNQWRIVGTLRDNGRGVSANPVTRLVELEIDIHSCQASFVTQIFARGR